MITSLILCKYIVDFIVSLTGHWCNKKSEDFNMSGKGKVQKCFRMITIHEPKRVKTKKKKLKKVFCLLSMNRQRNYLKLIITVYKLLFCHFCSLCELM